MKRINGISADIALESELDKYRALVEAIIDHVKWAEGCDYPEPRPTLRGLCSVIRSELRLKGIKVDA